jgi:hypothetical protein
MHRRFVDPDNWQQLPAGAAVIDACDQIKAKAGHGGACAQAPQCFIGGCRRRQAHGPLGGCGRCVRHHA